MRIRIPQSGRVRLLLSVAASAGAIGAAAAAVVYVNADRLDVVDKKRTVAKTVATVDRATPLTVIAKEGRWYKVEVNGKQGYVAETVVSDSPQGKKGQSVALSAIGNGSNPALESAAAVKGVTPGASRYASGKGYNTAGLLAMQKRRDAITPDEFERFLAEGGRGAAVRNDAGPGGSAVAANQQ
jgi:uncharacterized protein YgiM (DUF1202 family)